jgi:hypothetical protein
MANADRHGELSRTDRYIRLNRTEEKCRNVIAAVILKFQGNQMNDCNKAMYLLYYGMDTIQVFPKKNRCNNEAKNCMLLIGIIFLAHCLLSVWGDADHESNDNHEMVATPSVH